MDILNNLRYWKHHCGHYIRPTNIPLNQNSVDIYQVTE